MIPKIIHYAWFGGNPLPNKLKAYIDTWHKVMPDYRIIVWNEQNFNPDFCAYTRQAYRLKQYAFVADVARLQAVYTMGGIYLDTDIEVLKPFDPFLADKSFIGRETDYIGTGIFGAEAGAPWLKVCLDFYIKRNFVNIWGHPVRTPGPKLLTQKIMPSVPETQRPKVYDHDIFCANNPKSLEQSITGRTVCIHHFSNTWGKKHESLPQKIKKLANGFKARYL